MCSRTTSPGFCDACRSLRSQGAATTRCSRCTSMIWRASASNAARIAGDTIIDAAGPETMSFDELVRAIRGAVGARSPILHLPPTVMSAASRVLGPARPRRRAHARGDQRPDRRAARLARPAARPDRFQRVARRAQQLDRQILRQRAATPFRHPGGGAMRCAGRSPSACPVRACRARLGFTQTRSLTERVPIAPVGL